MLCVNRISLSMIEVKMCTDENRFYCFRFFFLAKMKIIDLRRFVRMCLQRSLSLAMRKSNRDLCYMRDDEIFCRSSFVFVMIIH